MKLTLLPPDINASREYFVVQNERIVFGLLGIKGLGTTAAAEIVNKRNEGGPYKNFLDFLDRVDLRVINKKSLEALIKTGCFDSIGQPRALLFFNAEKAVEYAESKKQDKAQGQVSLFEGSGEKEFKDFAFTQVEEWQNAQKLVFEKEFIGCYVSAHPLDAYRNLIEKKATLHSVDATVRAAETAAMPMSENFNRAGTQYVVIGSIQGLQEIITKKGGKMARAELEDLYGKIKVLFFPKTWERLVSRVHDDAVLALSGTVRSDKSGEQPVFYVDDIPDLNTLKDKQRQELHICVSNFCPQPEQNFELRDFLFSVSGGGSVFFHINEGGKKFIVKANGSVGAPLTNAFMQELEKNRAVESAWYA
jgi:DNA polymerase-3 subunit alpha